MRIDRSNVKKYTGNDFISLKHTLLRALCWYVVLPSTLIKQSKYQTTLSMKKNDLKILNRRSRTKDCLIL